MSTNQNKFKKTRIKTLVILLFIAFLGVFRVTTFYSSASKKLPDEVAELSHRKSEIIGEVISMDSRAIGVFMIVSDENGNRHPVFGTSGAIEKIRVGDLVDIISEDGVAKYVSKI